MDMIWLDGQPGDGGRDGSRIGPERKARRARWAVPAALALALSWPFGAAAADGDPPLGADCDSTTGCLTAALTGLVSGFTSTAGSQLWGWIMGGSQSAGVSAITGDLNTIVSQLTAIEDDLTEIEKELELLQCSFDANFVDTNAGPIQSYYDTYQNWLVSMQNGATPPDIDDVSEWANCVVGFPTGGQSCQDDKVLTYMQTLNDLATAGAGSAGSIADCVSAKGSVPAANTLDDRPYYAAVVQPITDWYLGVNTQAMVVLTEAYHFRAWQSAGSPSGSADDLYANVCETSQPPQGCAQPITVYNQDFVTFARQQLAAGGAPYSTDTHLLVNGTGQMLVRSIETYNAAAGVTCPDPQVDPTCGPAAGKPNTFSMRSYAVSPYGYGGGSGAGTWKTTDQELFESLLDQGFNQTQTQPTDGTVTPGEFLCTMSMTPDPSSCTQTNGGEGLQNADKLVRFPQTYNFQVNGGTIGTLQCFLDGFMGRATSPQPFCSTLAFDQILEPIISGPGCPSLNWAQTAANVVSHIPYYPNWYDAYYCFAANGWYTQPGYLLNPEPQDYAAFWWPSLDLTSITCDNGDSPLDASNANPAGVPALCRQKDFEIWFEAIVPPGPTTATATADTTLSPRARNTNDGAGQQLRLAGWPNLGRQLGLVAFDPAELEAFLAAGPLESAWLVLTSADQSGGRRGHWVAATPLRAAFVEGNGDVAGNDRGTGWGATWNCAEDAEIADDVRECVQESYASGERLRQGHAWWRDRGSRDRAVVFQPDGYASQVIWDVTRNVERGVSAWTLRSLRGSGSLSYHTREGAAALDDPSLAPILILTHPAEDVVAEVADD